MADCRYQRKFNQDFPSKYLLDIFVTYLSIVCRVSDIFITFAIENS